jgi:hypothetical protein
MAVAFTAWHRGEDTDEAEAGAMALADAVHELRELKRVVVALAKALSR